MNVMLLFWSCSLMNKHNTTEAKHKMEHLVYLYLNSEDGYRASKDIPTYKNMAQGKMLRN